MRHLRPDDLPLIRAHIAIDMTPRELSRWLDIPEAEVHYAAAEIGVGVHFRPSALFTPARDADRRIAEHVDLATWQDEYEPLSADEWQAHLAVLEATQ